MFIAMLIWDGEEILMVGIYIVMTEVLTSIVEEICTI